MLDGDILSLDPAKLAQLLPERLQADRATGSSGILQETYAGDFPCLLRVDGKGKGTEHCAKSQERDFFLHVFFVVSIHSTRDTRSFSFDHLVRSRQHIRRIG